MFRKVLIANRGEIARRIIATCNEMGIHTVAVYSEADKEAPFVREAGEAYLLGDAPPSESYLAIDKILAIARQTGVDAIHPGYGFLAESPDFAEACQQAGVVFIGPDATVIRRLGDKGEAKRLAEQVGVPVVPGFTSPKRLTPEQLLQKARQIGFPLLLKAVAGGGGKGLLATHASCWNATCSVHAISKCRSLLTITARCSTSSNANARSSAAIRKLLRKALRPRWTPKHALPSRTPRCA